MLMHAAFVADEIRGFMPEPARINSLSKNSIQVGRINLEPSQATASKHWSLHSVRVRARVRVRVGWSAVSKKREPSSHVSGRYVGAVQVHSSTYNNVSITYQV